MNIDLKRLRNDATLVATEHKTFESRLDLQTFLHQLALQYNKEFTVAPNNNKTRYEVRCTAAECPFKIIAIAPIDSEVWCITKAVTHAAGCVASPKTYFPPKIIAYILKEDFRCERPFSPKALEKSSFVITNGTSAARTIRAAQNYLYGDRESNECSCGALEKEVIPCVHLLVLLSAKGSRGVELCSELHSTQRFLKTYSGKILSVDDIKLHSVVKQTLEDKIESDILTQPPIPTPRAGRPGVVRKRRSNEPRGPNSRSEKFTDAVEPAPKQRRKYTCKVCRVEGHNARGCPNKDKE
ncbi:hypothetical protein P9112_004447 [Eukaryota sp. TZLM1-RC]